MDENLAACKARGRRQRKGSDQITNSDPLIKFLRQRVSRLNYGEKVPDLGQPAKCPSRRERLFANGTWRPARRPMAIAD
jgi:hypothetical protein